ncbi:MAG: hypothetical protein ACRDT8_18330, partial [Micromonosporaceae bacterium]
STAVTLRDLVGARSISRLSCCTIGAMSHQIAQAGNTVVPAVLALEGAGFRVSQRGEYLVAESDEGSFVADDPVALLGLVKLVECRGWEWQPSDSEIQETLERFGWAG